MISRQARLQKTTAISRVAVRDTDVSHGAPIGGSLKSFEPSQQHRIEGFEGCPQLDPHYAERRQPLNQRMQFFPAQIYPVAWVQFRATFSYWGPNSGRLKLLGAIVT